MHELHIIEGQRAFQGIQDIHDGRGGGQQPAGIGGPRHELPFGEGQFDTIIGQLVEAVHGDGADGRERIPTVHRKLERPFVPAAAFHDTHHQLRPGADGVLRGGGDGFRKRFAAVRADFQRGGANGARRGHPDRHIGIERRITGEGGPGLATVHRQAGDIAPRLPLYGDGHNVWGLSPRGQHVTHAVHKRPRAQHGGKVRAFADQIGLAHNALGANTGHQGFAVNPTGNDPGRAVDQILHVAHSNMTPSLAVCCRHP